jgi:hypothetical protein
MRLPSTANLKDIDPQAWLADVLARLPDHPANRIDQLLPSWGGTTNAEGSRAYVREPKESRGSSSGDYDLLFRYSCEEPRRAVSFAPAIVSCIKCECFRAREANGFRSCHANARCGSPGRGHQCACRQIQSPTASSCPQRDGRPPLGRLCHASPAVWASLARVHVDFLGDVFEDGRLEHVAMDSLQFGRHQ